MIKWALFALFMPPVFILYVLVRAVATGIEWYIKRKEHTPHKYITTLSFV